MTISGVSTFVNPYDIIEFIEQHAAEKSSIVNSEMAESQANNQLTKDISDLVGKLNQCETQIGSDASTPAAKAACAQAKQAIEAFMQSHPEAQGGGSENLVPMWLQLSCWAQGTTPQNAQWTNYGPSGESWGASFHVTYDAEPGAPDATAAKGLIDDAVTQLNAWSSSVGGDDKIAQMQLQEEADDLKNLYEEGSNLCSTQDQITAALIQNMGH